ncbi:MAG TPA: hypothetical protein VII11_11895 [Bacteroidota bacterium]
MAKKTKESEYVLRIYHHLDERTNTKGVMFAVETVEIFTNFRYDILLEDRRNKSEIELKIVGLHAPAMLMPGKGPARGTREYHNLKGTYTVRVKKMEKETNEFIVHITLDRIIVKNVSENPFIISRVDPLKITTV